MSWQANVLIPPFISILHAALPTKGKIKSKTLWLVQNAQEELFT